MMRKVGAVSPRPFLLAGLRDDRFFWPNGYRPQELYQQLPRCTHKRPEKLVRIGSAITSGIPVKTKITAAMLLAGALPASAPVFAGEQISGHASVIDGNTIEIDNTKLRLYGIIAPESAQRCGGRSGVDYPCGEEAAYALDLYLSESRPTTCDVIGRDRQDRSLATCLRSDGSSVNGWMVAMGWAVDGKRAGAGRFSAEQQSARSRQLGVWQGEFSLPCAVEDEDPGPCRRAAP